MVGASADIQRDDSSDQDRLFALAEGYYSGYSRYAANTDGVRMIAVLRPTPA